MAGQFYRCRTGGARDRKAATERTAEPEKFTERAAPSQKPRHAARDLKMHSKANRSTAAEGNGFAETSYVHASDCGNESVCPPNATTASPIFLRPAGSRTPLRSNHCILRSSIRTAGRPSRSLPLWSPSKTACGFDRVTVMGTAVRHLSSLVMRHYLRIE